MILICSQLMTQLTNFCSFLLFRLVFPKMDRTKSSHICRFSVHRIEFRHIVMVRLGLLCEYGLWRNNASAELVLATGSYQYLSCIHTGRGRWEACEEDRAVWPVGRTVRPWIRLLYSAIDTVLFVQHLWSWTGINTTDSHVFHRLDGAIQFLHFSLWEI